HRITPAYHPFPLPALNGFEVLLADFVVIEEAGDRRLAPVDHQGPVVVGYEPLLAEEILFGADPLVGVIDPDNTEVRAVNHREGGEIPGGVKLVVLDELLRQR